MQSHTERILEIFDRDETNLLHNKLNYLLFSAKHPSIHRSHRIPVDFIELKFREKNETESKMAAYG